MGTALNPYKKYLSMSVFLLSLFKHNLSCIMGVILLLMFQLTILCVPSSHAEVYKFCDAKPLGKYCLPDGSGWRECLIDALDDPAEELHHCPAGSRYVRFIEYSVQYLLADRHLRARLREFHGLSSNPMSSLFQ